MANYIGVHCPVCSKRFVDDDDIVVCPICGAPHHRACYQQLGHCALHELHLKGHTWQPPEDKRRPVENSDAQEIACPSCGAHNPSSGIFCQVCGARLASAGGTSPAQQPPRQNPFGNPFSQMPGKQPASMSAYAMAFGGLSPDEEIDGVSARDIAIYVGDNSQYFLPRFKHIAENGGTAANWAALLFNFLYFFYRKMFLMGGILLVLMAIAQIPLLFTLQETYAFVIANIDDILIGIMPKFTPQNNLWAYSVLPYMRFLSLAFGMTFALFANRFYMKHVFTNIRRIRASLVPQDSGFDDKVYTDLLAKKGRTSRNAVILIIVSAIVLYLGLCVAIASTVM